MAVTVFLGVLMLSCTTPNDSYCTEPQDCRFGERCLENACTENTTYFKAGNTDALDRFGEVVAISRDGKTLAVAATGESSGTSDPIFNSSPSSGAVYVFTLDGTNWIQQAYIKARYPDPGDGFGGSLSLSDDGRTLAIGAPGEDSGAVGVVGTQDDNSAEDSGAVYVYIRSGSSWILQAYLKASNGDAGDAFGVVSLSGDGSLLAVGALGEASNATTTGGQQDNNLAPGSGAAYVFGRNASEGNWTQLRYIKALGGGSFGSTVAFDTVGNVLAIGAPNADGQLQGSGVVSLFVRSGSTWIFAESVTANNPGANDWFGTAIALSGQGTTLAVGAFGEDSNAKGIGPIIDNNLQEDSGAVYVFQHTTGRWMEEVYIKASNAALGDRFGKSVALNHTGTTLAVGAVGEDSNAVGIDGNELDRSALDSGSVYVFEYDSVWSQRVYVKPTTSHESGAFGSSVGLAGDTDSLAVGAPGESSNAIGVGGDANDRSKGGAGAVYLY